MTDPRLIVERTAKDVVMLSFNQPDILNPLSRDLMGELSDLLDRLAREAPRVKALLLTGRGRAFSAGGNLAAHRDRPADVPPYDLGEVLEDWYNPMLLRLLAFPAPVVIAVNGPAAGAGCPLALCGDVVVAARSAYFQCGFTRIGLVPDLGATWLLPRLIGRARAHAMLMLDQRISAEQAEQWGMIHQCVDDDLLPEAALALAQRLAAGPTAAIAGVRRLVLDGAAQSVAEALAAEATMQRTMSASADFAEGVNAFFSKRPARFTGD
jgi:2-(1,2-epoxy-1,2-dihydrophenyl)acetyl-CoA isomerase